MWWVAGRQRPGTADWYGDPAGADGGESGMYARRTTIDANASTGADHPPLRPPPAPTDRRAVRSLAGARSARWTGGADRSPTGPSTLGPSPPGPALRRGRGRRTDPDQRRRPALRTVQRGGRAARARRAGQPRRCGDSGTTTRTRRPRRAAARGAAGPGDPPPMDWLVIQPPDLATPLPGWFAVDHGLVRPRRGVVGLPLRGGVVLATRADFVTRRATAHRLGAASDGLVTVAVTARAGGFLVGDYGGTQRVYSGGQLAAILGDLPLYGSDLRLWLTWPSDPDEQHELATQARELAETTGATVWTPPPGGSAELIDGRRDLRALDYAGEAVEWQAHRPRFAAGPPALRRDTERPARAGDGPPQRHRTHRVAAGRRAAGGSGTPGRRTTEGNRTPGRRTTRRQRNPRTPNHRRQRNPPDAEPQKAVEPPDAELQKAAEPPNTEPRKATEPPDAEPQRATALAGSGLTVRGGLAVRGGDPADPVPAAAAAADGPADRSRRPAPSPRAGPRRPPGAGVRPGVAAPGAAGQRRAVRGVRRLAGGRRGGRRRPPQCRALPGRIPGSPVGAGGQPPAAGPGGARRRDPHDGAPCTRARAPAASARPPRGVPAAGGAVEPDLLGGHLPRGPPRPPRVGGRARRRPLAIRCSSPARSIAGLPNEVRRWPTSGTRRAYALLPAGRVCLPGRWLRLYREPPPVRSGRLMLEVRVPRGRAIDVTSTADELAPLTRVRTQAERLRAAQVELILSSRSYGRVRVRRAYRAERGRMAARTADGARAAPGRPAHFSPRLPPEPTTGRPGPGRSPPVHSDHRWRRRARGRRPPRPPADLR